MPSLEQELRRTFGSETILSGVPLHYVVDATEARGLRGRADVVAKPQRAEDLAAIVRWCYERDIPIVPRGGGTGFAGGSVPIDGGLVLSLERLNGVLSFDPLLWRMNVQAGVTTARVRTLARESGLLFPPDPGAAEQSQIGGNAATNAGGPHAFKYGVTGAWVTGLEAVLPPGDVVRVSGPLRKDVAGYDLKSLLIGSEGTLGVITALWLRLIPAPERALPVLALFRDTQQGCDAIERVLGSGLQPAALEYLDSAAVERARIGAPIVSPEGGGFLVIAEADGDDGSARAIQRELLECLGDNALSVNAVEDDREIASLWHWRDGVSLAVQAVHGGKLSEDIVVPVDRLAEAIDGVAVLGREHGLPTCSWGHAGDGNLHATFMFDPSDAERVVRAQTAAAQLFDLALELGGSVSCEHGVGHVKAPFASAQFSAPLSAAFAGVKAALDPKGLMNPGKKLGLVDTSQQRVTGAQLALRASPRGETNNVERGVDDGVGVDTEVLVQIADVAGLAEVGDAQRS